MIKTLTANTAEIDDVNAAVEEILQQLDLEKNLMKNSTGFVACYPEFIESGVIKALSEKLPFDISGVTTFACADNKKHGQLVLVISVLTSDDVFFSASQTEPINPGNLRSALDSAYRKAAARLPEKPSMVMVFSPFTFDMAGDDIVREMDAVTGGIPIFGTNAIDDSPNYKNAKTFYNADAHQSKLSMILLCGNTDPAFSIGTISDDRILSQKAIVTCSKGNSIVSVNEMPVLDYMRSLGLAPDGEMISFAGVPLIIDFNDGTKPAARVVIDITKEGHVVCGANVPENTILSVGAIDRDEVLAVSQELAQGALNSRHKNGAIVFSCLARNSALGIDANSEMLIFQKVLEDKIPFFMSYSGGEFCPVPNSEGKLVNRFHNDTIILCRF